MRVFHGLAELSAAAGEHLGHSSWHQITQDQIDEFARATGDEQWIHVDPQRAAAGPFATTIAHGYLTLSLIPMLASEIYRVDDLVMGVNYGCNKVRFPAPVPVGSRIRAGVELMSVTSASLGSQIATKVTIELQGSDKPACVAETLAVMVGKD
ncbi:MAG: MaoC family dehydratase [Actinobacteria bacterium]|jgi:acyl dehydratase|nr:MaoC family dehydratase [Micrococcales bacterium]MCB0903410.1 MaoC family dehydratase [Actinomycetota bacterium]MCO5300109.1 MaoC family dehydratase [Candidatus Nanopelagicales bacterium]MCB9429374.1 MaoC family dehydratase [Actinomycetota bacterium]HPE11698.1 MaoC family dehydratase [Actinomycetota bacterium]